ncbi:MAG: potassium transporter TrkG [Desulfobacterales bacterium]
MTDIEVVPKDSAVAEHDSMAGGMGIIVLSVAILPFLGVGGMQLYKAEVPSPVPDKLKPRISDTAKILWKVYALFPCAIAAAADRRHGFYDALCHTSDYASHRRIFHQKICRWPIMTAFILTA